MKKLVIPFFVTFLIILGCSKPTVPISSTVSPATLDEAIRQEYSISGGLTGDGTGSGILYKYEEEWTQVGLIRYQTEYKQVQKSDGSVVTMNVSYLYVYIKQYFLPENAPPATNYCFLEDELGMYNQSRYKNLSYDNPDIGWTIDI